MTNDHYVYGLFRPDNGTIFYVGMGRGNRAWQHQQARRRGRGYKDNIICKMIDDLGYTDIPIVILRDAMTRPEAIDLEIALIYAIGRYPHGPLANIVKGGEGLADPTPEFRVKHGARMRHALADPKIRARMSAKAKARPREGMEWEQRRRARMSDSDVIAKLSSAKLGKLSAKKGKKSGPSARGKAAQRNLQWITDGIEQTRVNRSLPIPEGWRVGRLQATEQAKANMSAAVRPLLTEEHKRKLSAVAKGRPIPWFHTPEVRARARRNRKGRKWITDGTLARTIMPEDSVPEGWRYGRNTAGRPAWNLGLRR